MYYYEVTKNAILESKIDGKFYLVDFRKNVTDPNEYNWYFTVRQIMCNSSHHLQKATEKVLFAYKLTQNKVHQSTLRHCIQYEKTVFQRRPYRGEGILATVVKRTL